MLELYRPVKTNRINQGWGENHVCIKVDANGKIVRPSKVIAKSGDTCPVGYADMYKLSGLLGHNGIDWHAYYGEPVYHSASFNGWVRTEHDLSGGMGVDVVSHLPLLRCTEPNCDEYHHVKLRAWHGSKFVACDKQEVKAGDVIMLAGSTGDSSGVHVHWGPKWCDENGVTLHANNGMSGYFDPTPYFTNEFVFDIIGKTPPPLTFKQKICSIFSKIF